MSKDRQRAEKLLNVARQAASGKEIEGLFRTSRPVMHDFAQMPWRKRPWVLNAPEVKSSPWRKLLVGALSVFSIDSLGSKPPFTPEDKVARQRAFLEDNSVAGDKGSDRIGHFFGPARSIAADLFVATMPRSKARVLSLLCVTHDELMLLHVPETYRLKHYANAVEVGWRVERAASTWTRNSNGARVMPKVQFGFTDGSWMTLHTEPVEGMPSLTDVFPDILPPDQPIPPHPDYPAPEPKK
jgi:hypothetical protein